MNARAIMTNPPPPTTSAESPADISRHGWRDVLRRAFTATLAEDTALAAAGIAFYAVWALFPALVILVIATASLLGRSEVIALLSWLRLDLPDTFNGVIVGQLDAIAERSRAASYATLGGALLIALWSGMRGTRGLMTALNTVYQEEERRPLWRREVLALGLSLLGGAFLLVALAAIVGLAGSGNDVRAVALLAPSRWPALILMMMTLLSIAYRHGPCRRTAKWRWVTWGAAASATIWVTGSSLLAGYAANYTHLNPLLGSLGSVTLFLFWVYLTVLVVLLGAHINAELEQHTAADTTEGAPRPAGQRGATVADARPRDTATR